MKPELVFADRPEFADNREVKLADAINAHLDWLEQTYKSPCELAIATGYFNPEGFGLLAPRLAKLRRTRLLLGAEPAPPPARPLRMPGDPRGENFERKLIEHALGEQREGLERDRNLLDFQPENDEAIAALLEFLKSGRLEVRRYEKAFLHGKAFLFNGNEGVLAGSSNFTAAGLTRNLELNLGRYDPSPVERVQDWFEQLWHEAPPFDLAAVYQTRYAEYAPYLIYLRVLWERYRNDLQDESPAIERIRLTTFQNDGLGRARRILEKHHGVLIADGVGLGKMFLAGELLRGVVEENRQRALLIAPAALRDGAWARFADRHQIYIETVSFEELADEVQLGGTTPRLKNSANDYALIVVDEAQALRNPDTRRARALRQLLQGQPPKKLVLISATPVNNSLWDLYYLLNFFIRQDGAFAGLGIRSLKDRFTDAVRRDPDDLKPDLLFDILDATTVRRTRHFVQRYYPGDHILGPQGEEIQIRFPTPHVRAVHYRLDEVLPGFFQEFKAALAPEPLPGAGAPRAPVSQAKLTLARYEPSQYLQSGPRADLREAALAALIRSGLLKRFESSVHAFAVTCRRMAEACGGFLAGLDQGVVMNAEGIEEWRSSDSDEPWEQLLAAGYAEPAQPYDQPRLRAAAANDQALLLHFAQTAEAISIERDPKLKALTAELLGIQQTAERDSRDEAGRRDQRKVIIFSFYADTAQWICRHLEATLAADRRLAAYRGRLTCVSGEEGYQGISREAAVYGFAPRSAEAPAGRDRDLYDILVTTDVLSEGMNLQQARHIINYDLPWNPMRLVQRHGRIDRIGSPHREVYIRCFFPDDALEALLDLEDKIRRKLAQAAASIGVEDEVIPGASTSEIVFADERREIEKLRQENNAIFVNAGEDPAAHSGEEYRQELRKGLEIYGRQIPDLPWGAGSGLWGRVSGHFFCARIGERVFLRFIPRSGTPPGPPVRDSLSCLKFIACAEATPRHLSPSMRSAAYAAWRQARADMWAEWTLATDPKNLQPRVRPALKSAASHLRQFPPPGIEQQTIQRAIEALEAPWGMRIEREIRAAWMSEQGAAASAAILDAIQRLGLEPYQAPRPLPPIEAEDVLLICWLAVEQK